MDTKAKEKAADSQVEKRNVVSSIMGILKEIADFKGWEIIFQVLLYGFIGWGIYALYIVYQFHHHPQYADVPKFSIYDFKLATIPTFLFFLYKNLCIKIFYNWNKTHLDPAKFETEEERHARAVKGAIWMSHVIYYSVTSVGAYFLFKDAFFFPTLLGGEAKCSDIYKYSPYVPEFPYGVLFYQVQFGWHFHNLIDHVVYKWKDPKFWEMFLHHSVAVFLIFFSYLSNQIAVGILVLATHDPSDIGLCASRYYNDMKKPFMPLLLSIYALFMISWVFLRLFVFPKCVVGQAFMSYHAYQNDMMAPVYLYMMLMMSALVILHFYWFTIVLRIPLGLISGKSKKNYNTYDKEKSKSK